MCKGSLQQRPGCPCFWQSMIIGPETRGNLGRQIQLTMKNQSLPSTSAGALKEREPEPVKKRPIKTNLGCANGIHSCIGYWNGATAKCWEKMAICPGCPRRASAMLAVKEGGKDTRSKGCRGEDCSCSTIPSRFLSYWTPHNHSCPKTF